jgi:hypothetical protein
MLRRLLVAVLLAVILGLGLLAGQLLRQKVASVFRHGGEPSSERIEVSVSGTDVPGCIVEGAAFRAVIRSQWGEKRSENVLVFHWARAAGSSNAILVSAEGQAIQKTLQPGEALPPVALQLPLGDQSLQVSITTFVFDRLDSAGRACFRWASPPGTPLPVTPVPSPGRRT